jgi:hypothetical protein
MIQLYLLSTQKAQVNLQGMQIFPKAESVDFSFVNYKSEPVKNGLHAIFFKENGQTLYREIVDGQCSVPLRSLLGTTQIRVCYLEGYGNTVWDSDTIIFKEISDTHVGMYLAETDMLLQIVALTKVVDQLKETVENQNTEIQRLNERITNALEGYDIT